MKKLSLFLLLFSQILFAKTSLERVEPAFWWVGMQNPELQLMVYGEDASALDVTVDYPGIVLERTVQVENSNYLFLYLKLDKTVKPGRFNLNFSQKGKIKHTFEYELRKREMNSRMREGFNTSDVMYLITPDRFVNGNPDNDNVEGTRENQNRAFHGGRHGGDIQGISNSLDYIKDMGFTTVWLNPVLENDMESYSYHGYSTTDFYKVDPHYGDNEEYRAMVEKANSMGIKVIMDMIVNHIGSLHWWMNDLPTADWINNNAEYLQTSHNHETNLDPYASQYDKAHFSDGWFVESMPDLNQRNKLLATYLIQNSIWWIEYAHLSGIRMDTWPYPDKYFMNDWITAVMNEYPNFNVVGEVWKNEPAMVAYWQKGQTNVDGFKCDLPSMMDFPMQEAIVQGMKNDGRKTYHTLSMDFLYPDPDNLVVFLDNHDMSRVFTQLDEDFDAYKRAVAYLTILRGIPQVYYGTEVLMSNPDTWEHGIIRSDFPGGWQGDSINVFTGEGLSEQQKEAQEFVKHLMNWRQHKEVIHQGKTMQFAPLYDEKVYTMARYSDEDLVLLIMNNSDKDAPVNWERYKELTDGISSMTDVITGKLVDISGDSMVLSAKGFLLLEK